MRFWKMRKSSETLKTINVTYYTHYINVIETYNHARVKTKFYKFAMLQKWNRENVNYFADMVFRCMYATDV